MLWFSAWNADRVTNWNLYFRAPSSFWNAATWASRQMLAPVNDGEQLYASILPGYFAWIAAANFDRFAEIGLRGLEPEQSGIMARRRARARWPRLRRPAPGRIPLRSLAGDEALIVPSQSLVSS